MQTLYIDRKDSELVASSGRLSVLIAGAARPFSVPLNVLEFIVVSAAVRFSSTLLTQLTLAGVTLVFVNPRREEATCVVHGLLHNDAERRLLQYRVVSDAHWQLEYSRELVRAKLRAQQATLLLALNKRPDQRLALTKGQQRLAELTGRVTDAATVDSLRGIEGAGAAAYFSAFQQVFAASLAFNGRNRRPPRDPVNVVLSLSYTLIHAEAIRVLVAVGFDPHLGVYHLPSYGRESLACDLVELYRPQIDRWVWRLFADQLLRLDHFTLSDSPAAKPCILGKAGRAQFYREYEIRARRLRRTMRVTARYWLARLQSDHQCRSLPPQNDYDAGEGDESDLLEWGES